MGVVIARRMDVIRELRRMKMIEIVQHIYEDKPNKMVYLMPKTVTFISEGYGAGYSMINFNGGSVLVQEPIDSIRMKMETYLLKENEDG